MNDKPKILVVDDDPSLRKTLSDILRVKGYTVATAETGAAGIAEAQREGGLTGVALIDLKLPDMTGIAVMERIKAASPLTEVIILTGNATLDTAVEATNKGAFSYLIKPYEIDKLLRHIRRALDRQRTQQEIMRLASFPKLDPNPIVEVGPDGGITYLNPATERVFPDLAALGIRHPLLNGLEEALAAFRTNEAQETMCEIAFGDTTYERYVYYVPESGLLRVTALDVTQRKRHEEKIKRLNSFLRAVLNINQYLLVAKSEEDLFYFVCKTLTELGHVAAWVGLKMPDHSVKPAAWAGFDEATVSNFNVRWDAAGRGRGIMGTAIRESVIVIVEDAASDPRLEAWRDVVQRWQIGSGVGLPLVVEKETLGALAVFSRNRAGFDDEAVKFLNEVAGDIAVAIHALRLGRKLYATLGSLRKSLDGTVEAIASMVELRDPYTAGHERRVAQLACAIGKEMGLPERQVEGLRVIGYIHDIGKIAVPAEILSKPAALAQIELEMVKAHAKAGYDILKNLEFPWPVAEAVLQHHERLDGSGYPQGLKDRDIILEARIVMVADVVEAMASHRPYRASQGMEAALDEIRANRGKLYDATVVDTCVKLFTEQAFRFDGEL